VARAYTPRFAVPRYVGRDAISGPASRVKRHSANAQQPHLRPCIFRATPTQLRRRLMMRAGRCPWHRRAPRRGRRAGVATEVARRLTGEFAYVEFRRLDGLCDYRTRPIWSPSGWPNARVSVLGARASPRASRPRRGTCQAPEGARGRGRRFCPGPINSASGARLNVNDSRYPRAFLQALTHVTVMGHARLWRQAGARPAQERSLSRRTRGSGAQAPDRCTRRTRVRRQAALATGAPARRPTR
jgi:hypothetical protein